MHFALANTYGRAGENDERGYNDPYNIFCVSKYMENLCSK